MTFIQSKNLIINGSFELFDEATADAKGDWWGARKLPGWTLEGTAKDGSNWFEIVKSGHRGVVTEYGSRWLDMDASSGNISIRQQVEGVEAGKQYTLFVTLASSGKGEGIDIFWGGQKIKSIVPDSLTMQTYSIVVTGSEKAEANTLRLVGTGNANGIGVSLDDVSLVRNPDPIKVDPNIPFVINAMNDGTLNVDNYKYGAESGREFFVNFDAGTDKVHVLGDLATSWADLQAKAAIYQSEGSTVVEFHDGKNVMVFTQTDVSKLGPQSFAFVGAPSVTTKTVGANLIKNGSFENFGAIPAVSLPAPISLTGVPTVTSLLTTAIVPTTATSLLTTTALAPTFEATSWGVGAYSMDGWSLSGTATKGTNWFELHNSGVRSVAASDGKYWLDLDASNGNITASQQVKGVEEGRYYTLTFNAASSKAGNSVDVYWDGVKVGSVTPAGTAMQEFSFVVEGHVGADMNKLSFVGAGSADGHGVSLDNVRMFAHETVAQQAEVHKFGLGSGRQYVTNFDVGIDTIIIRSDLFENFEQLKANSAIYQDGKTTIIEINNGQDLLILPQFDMSKFSAEMFKFEGAIKTTASRAKMDLRQGTDGDDTMVAGAGNQVFDGGAGFDVITGGVGADKFQFHAKSGHDFITDFTAGEDKLVIFKDLVDSYETLLKTGAIYQDGNSTQIEFADGQLITLFGVNAKTVSADWFSFG